MAPTSSVHELLDWPAASSRLLCFEEQQRPEGGKQHVCSWAGPLQTGHKDAAGQAFHTQMLKLAGLFVYPPEPGSEPDSPRAAAGAGLHASASSTSLDSDQPPPGVNWKGSKKKKSKNKKDAQDLYALLGLANERWTATETQLKNAYRRTCLEHHPDKKLAGVTDEAEKIKAEEYFKQVQEAYTVLSDPARRREYDSVDEFDDSLPLDCAPSDFFKVFGPAFRRNARWSASGADAVPDVGDAASPWEAVDKFYAFWFTFKSWREFPHPDEDDVEGAESREHRRWIERQNSKLREKGKKEEGRRLREFVEAAYRLDPRVTAHKEEERQERERKKAEKEEARRKLEAEEAARKAAEEAAATAAEEARKQAADGAKKAREAAKRAQKKDRQRLRLVCEGGDGVERLTDEDSVDKLCQGLSPDQLQALCDQLCSFGISREQQREAVQAALDLLMGAAAAEAAAKERQRKAAEAALKDVARQEQERKLQAMREWTAEELRMLDKAQAKFPQGTPRRWEVVTAYVRTRTLEEVLLMVKEKQGMSATRVKAQEDYRAGIKKKAEVQSQADLRAHAFTDVNVAPAGDAASTGQEEGEAGAAAGPTASLTPAPAAQAAANGRTPPAAQGAAAAAGGGVGAKGSAGSRSGAATAPTAAAVTGPIAAATGAPAATPTAAAAGGQVAAAAATTTTGGQEAPKKKAAAVAADSGAWSEAQELSLVRALKQFGKELGTERWEKVAGEVPGKTKAQCFKRFKELKEAFKAKKAAGGAAGADDEGED